jgi:predicted NBD/HSP70 family sugar kinase|nr:MAG TPA: Head to tail joining protein [Caudoviricetes sp.]DAO64034.1 MAG TPA: Head to tail joining protein [Caudoviricetes sp.]
MVIEVVETAKEIYERLENERKSYVTRAEDCAKYTIPSLFPKETDNKDTKYETPWQSVGARGLNNLTAKLLLALFPPNSPFYKLTLRDDIAAYYEADPQAKYEIEQKLVQLEQIILNCIETYQIRVTINEALKQLLVAGNCCLFLPPKEGGIKLYRLSSYVIQRDALGNTIQLVATDKLTVATLPADVKNLVDPNKKPDEEVVVYTHIYYSNDDDRMYSYQEIEGKQIPGTGNNYPKDKCPWIPLRLIKLDGESYGRSYVEEYLGDLKSLEGLQKAIVELAAIAATVINLVNPNGITQVRKVTKCKNGGFAPGRRSDIETMQLEKQQDMQIAKQTADALEARLSYVFMLNSAVQRSGERVTAEEIRYVAGELEDTLGGIYSILSQELQLPLVRRLLAQLQSTGQIPQLPDNMIEPAITTGIEALGRGHDLNKLTTFLSLVKDIPEAQQRLQWGNLITAIASGSNIDTTGLVKSDEEMQQEMQQQAMLQMAQAATPQLAKGLVGGQEADTTIPTQ